MPKKLKNHKPREVTEIGAYYGGLAVKVEDGQAYWSVENWDGHNWTPINPKLYREIIKHHDSLPDGK